MWEFILNNFVINKLNILLASTGVLLTFLTALSAFNYIKIRKKYYYTLNFLYVISFMILILTKNWLIFLIAWELVTLTTALMLLWSNKKIVYQYFIIQFIGSSFLFYVILVAINRGYTEIGPINEVWLQNMFIIGLGMKSAIFGLHFWLAPIHSRAPSPVSAILSGWVVKLGFITCLKLIVTGNKFLLYLGILMAFYGGIKALLSTDYKVLLAYSSISQLGYIAIAIGSGTVYGFIGGIFHIIAHGLAKTGLFIGSGYWIKEYGTRSIYKFRDALTRQRVLTICTLVSFSSLMGLPLLAGYYSKYLIKHGLEGNIFVVILLHGTAIMTFLYALRFMKWSIFKDIFYDSDDSISSNKGNITANLKMNIIDKLSILTASILLIILGLLPSILTAFISNRIFNYHLLTGILYILIYFSLAIIILVKLRWIKIEEKELPSLDEFFKKFYGFFKLLSVNSLRIDTKEFFENYLYRILYNMSRWLYNNIFVSFQNQLLWIPVFLILIFIWIMI